MNLTKDTYEHILNFADDRAVVNMLLVNKKFAEKLNESFFKQLLEKRYPLLMGNKREGETWRHLYLRMVQYLSLLKEKSDIPYLNVEYDPEYFYNKYPGGYMLLYHALLYMLSSPGNHDIINLLLDKFEVVLKKIPPISYKMTLDDMLGNAVKSGDVKTMKILFDRGADDYHTALLEAAFADEFDIVKYLMDVHPPDQNSINQAIEATNNDEIKEYLRRFLN